MAAGAKGSVKLITFNYTPTNGARCAGDRFIGGQHFCLGVKLYVNLQTRLDVMQKEEFNRKQMHVEKNNQCFHNLHL